MEITGTEPAQRKRLRFGNSSNYCADGRFSGVNRKIESGPNTAAGALRAGFGLIAWYRGGKHEPF
jgi:hypothetical protein